MIQKLSLNRPEPHTAGPGIKKMAIATYLTIFGYCPAKTVNISQVAINDKQATIMFISRY
jgi:hypothetical protein